MDKLPEPEFKNDLNWPRLKVGVEEYMKSKESRRNFYFLLFSTVSSLRYYREITYYRKNFLFTAGIIPLFIISSYGMASYITSDPYAIAALENNECEKRYILKLKNLLSEAKKKGIEIPDNLIR